MACYEFEKDCLLEQETQEIKVCKKRGKYYWQRIEEGTKATHVNVKRMSIHNDAKTLLVHYEGVDFTVSYSKSDDLTMNYSESIVADN